MSCGIFVGAMFPPTVAIAYLLTPVYYIKTKLNDERTSSSALE